MGKWVQQIVGLQRADGSWGYFHGLSRSMKREEITTEQALRRLRALGLTKDDDPIRRVLDYIERCLLRETIIPDRREKAIDWDVFTSLMFAAWLRLFGRESAAALSVARQWAEVVEHTFAGGEYNHDDYIQTYNAQFSSRLRGSRPVAFGTFYHLALLPGTLAPSTEKVVLDYVLNCAGGIYYVYDEPLRILPKVFASRKCSHYLAAVELLAQYGSAPEQLGFVVEWLLHNRGVDGLWDMGADAKDGVYFPLSDSWRKADARKQDCTNRIRKLLNRLSDGCPEKSCEANDKKADADLWAPAKKEG